MRLHPAFFLLILACLCLPVDAASQLLQTQASARAPQPVAAVDPKIPANGALPEATEAEKVLKSEEAYQRRLLELTRIVDGLEKKMVELRAAVTRPPQADMEQIQEQIQVCETESAELLALALSPLAQLQRSELQDRIGRLTVELELIRRRWGTDWSVFGTDFFANAAQVKLTDQRPIPSSYRIRAGDKLRVSITSSLGARTEYAVTVDGGGGITIPGAGRVTAKDRTAAQLRSSLTDRLAPRFRQLAVDVDIESVAPVQVQVAGEVARPGTYTLDGLASAINALYAAGGPSKSGSFRGITLSRYGERKRIIDLYDFLLKGSKDSDLPLQDGDLVFVPSVGPTVVVDGEVNRPARYEPDFPLTLAGALQLAGGAKPGGYLQTVQVERVEKGEYKVLFSEPLQTGDGRAAFAVLPGDQITVMSVNEDRTNQVSIEGPVGSPGIYGFSEGMRVSDLVKKAQGLKQDTEVYSARADLVRVDPLKGTEIATFDLDRALAGDANHDLLLRKLDRLFIYEPDQVVFRPRLVTITGAVARPGTYRRTEGMRVSDAIAAAGGVLPQAYLSRANLVRYNGAEQTELVRVELQGALNGDAVANVRLRDRDEITVYTHREALWQDHTVKIEGAVQRPGEYVRSERMCVSDLIFAAGGLLPEADAVVELARCGAPGESECSSTIVQVDLGAMASGGADPELSDLDVVTVPSRNPSLRTPEIVFISGEVARPGPYALTSARDTLKDVIDRAGGLTDFADSNAMLFLRQKEGFENSQQEQDADIILQKSRLFADKQFLAQLAKMGVKLPDDFLQFGNQSVEMLSKPIEVASDDAELIKDTGEEVPLEEGSPETVLATMAKGASDGAKPSAMGPPLAEATEAQTEVEQTLGEVSTSARVSVNLRAALADPASPDNLLLRSGDRIFIPKLTNVVTVIGAVLHPHSFAAGSGKTADYYIERSGGYAQDASVPHVIVVRGNGDALPKGKVNSVEPGDLIVVPNTGLIEIANKWERTGSVTKVITDILSSVYVLTRF